MNWGYNIAIAIPYRDDFCFNRHLGKQKKETKYDVSYVLLHHIGP